MGKVLLTSRSQEKRLYRCSKKNKDCPTYCTHYNDHEKTYTCDSPKCLRVSEDRPACKIVKEKR